MMSPMVFDSNEEKYFSWYLDELVKAGVVISWGRPSTIVLADNSKIWSKKGSAKAKESIILRNQTYTPDFRVVWDKDSSKSFVTKIANEVNDDLPESYSTPFMGHIDQEGNLVSLIEIKGGFVAHDESRIYSILSKWVYQKFGLYVQRISVSTAPDSIFSRTFCPISFLFTDKTRKPRKLRFPPKTLEEFRRLK